MAARVLNGIVWKFRTGSAWRDVPERYGPWVTLHTLFRQWAMDGTFQRMSCTEICGVPDAGVTVLAKEIHQHHGSTP